jgi:threonine synthase
MLYGVWKGFRELLNLGVIHEPPRIIACEPGVRAPLATAIERNAPAVSVPSNPTDAYAIACNVNSYRGVRAVIDSEGMALRLSDDEMYAANRELSRTGMWAELSSAAGIAGLKQVVASGERFDGPVVAISTSSGFKDINVGRDRMPTAGGDWDEVRRVLRDDYGLSGT